MRTKIFSMRSGIYWYAFIFATVLPIAFGWTFAQAESAASAADPSGSAAESVQQDNKKPLDRKCPRCGQKITPGEACRNCGRIFKGSTGGADPTAGVQNRLKSDVSNINRTRGNIDRSQRTLNNTLRNMQRNIFRIRDINRRL